MKVVQTIADAFVAEGTSTVFSLMGDANMLFHDDLVRRHGVRVVPVRHENAAITMADGYARATGRIGVATVTCGPGIAQTTTALTSATRMRVPLVVFTGETPSADLWNPQMWDVGLAVAPTGARHLPIRSIRTVAETVSHAFGTAHEEQIPVVVSLPYDWQELPAETDVGTPRRGRDRPAVASLPPLPDAVEEAAAVIAAARRPVVIAGGGAVESGAREPVRRLAERTGALLATSLRAKDWFHGDPWDLGISGGLGDATSRRLVADADVVVAVGTQLGYFATDNGRLHPQARVVQVDLAPGRPREGRPFDAIEVRADARLGVEALISNLPEPTGPGYRTAEVKALLAERRPEVAAIDEPGRVDPTLAVRALDGAVDPTAQYVFGVGHFWSFAVMNTRRPDPRDYLYAFGFGAVGQGLGTAIGAAVGRDRPTVLVEGDGSLLMHIGELGTVADLALDLVIVVLNDGGYGSEIHKLGAKGGNGELARFHSTDFASVARGFGLEGHRARDPQHLSELVRWQRQTRSPLLIDVPMAHAAVSPPTRRALGLD